MFLVTIKARPDPTAEDFLDHGGGYVNCWIEANSEDDAITRAIAEIQAGNWIPGEIEAVEVVGPETYTDESHPGKQYFEQAVLDGVVLVYHLWPNEAQDDEQVH